MVAGFVVTIWPVSVGEGKVPKGNAKTFQELTVLLSVQPITALLVVIELAVTFVGTMQLGGGEQVTFAIQPA